MKNALWESVIEQTAVSLTRKRAFVKDLDQIKKDIDIHSPLGYKYSSS